MPRYVFVNLANMQEYVTGTLTDPNIPAGFFLTGGSDGAIDCQTWPDGTNTGIQQFVAGVNSGGFPAYTEDPVQAAEHDGAAINGIFWEGPFPVALVGGWGIFKWGLGLWGEKP